MSITKQHTIAQVLEANRQTARVFMQFGMFCLSCPHATAETLEEAGAAHGIDVDELVRHLNAAPAQEA